MASDSHSAVEADEHGTAAEVLKLQAGACPHDLCRLHTGVMSSSGRSQRANPLLRGQYGFGSGDAERRRPTAAKPNTPDPSRYSDANTGAGTGGGLCTRSTANPTKRPDQDSAQLADNVEQKIASGASQAPWPGDHAANVKRSDPLSVNALGLWPETLVT